MSDHGHQGFEIAPDKLTGYGADAVLIGQLVGSAFDACPTCPEPLLTLVAESAPTTAQLVELACLAVNETLGGIPVDLVDTADPSSPVPIGFRRAALSFIDGDSEALNVACTAMTAAERQAAASTATALFVGELRAAAGKGSSGYPAW